MTAEEKLAALQAWEARAKAISAVYEADRLACGALIESPRWEAVYGLLEAYTMMPPCISGGSNAEKEADRLACGALIESPRWEAVYGLLEAYTMMVAQAIAPDNTDAKDVAEWLDWWQEMDFGAKAGRAGFPGREMREIRTLEDLLWIIEVRP